MTGIRLRDAVVRYGDVMAVDRVSLDVAPGQVLVLLGASGSGKSSILRAIAGLEPLAGGGVFWGDDDSSRRCPCISAVSAWCSRTASSSPP